MLLKIWYVPIQLKIQLNSHIRVTYEVNNNDGTKTKWFAASPDMWTCYKSELDTILRHSRDKMTDEIWCNTGSHDSDIQVFSDHIIGACLTAAKRIIPFTQPDSNKPWMNLLHQILIMQCIGMEYMCNVDSHRRVLFLKCVNWRDLFNIIIQDIVNHFTH